MVAAAVHLLVNSGSHLPTVGASGAIAGVMGAYAVLFPRARIVTLIPVIIWPLFVHIPAVIFMGIWIVGQVLSGVGSLDAAQAASEVGGIAWWAHIGGFACGFVLGPWLVRSKSRGRASQEGVY